VAFLPRFSAEQGTAGRGGGEAACGAYGHGDGGFQPCPKIGASQPGHLDTGTQ